MIIQQTIHKLHEMKLTGMAQALELQSLQPDQLNLSFEERLGLLVDQEWTHRQNRQMTRRLRDAKLRIPACLEGIDYRSPRGLDRSVIRSLSTCQWLMSHQNVLITGPTGVGKSYIACALANAACRQGYTARYYRVPRLLSELAIAKADGTFPKLLTRLARIHLLVLDDWGLATLSTSESRDLLEVIDDRVQSCSTIVAGQLPLEHWHAAIGDPTVADAILDRLVHSSHKLVLKGESMRRLSKGDNEQHEPDSG